MGGGVFDRALFDLGDAGRDGNHNARTNAKGVIVNLANEVTQHRLGDVEVGDDAVLHRTNSSDVARGAAQHLLRLVAYGADLTRNGIEGHHGRLAQHDTLILDVNEGIGGAEVYADVVGKVAEEGFGHDSIAEEKEEAAVCGERAASNCRTGEVSKMKKPRGRGLPESF